MSLMDLVSRLKEHTGCTHTLEASMNAPARLLTVRHIQKVKGVESRETTKIPVFGDDSHAGSAVFHDAARFLVNLSHTERKPLTISDDEYAGFVARDD